MTSLKVLSPISPDFTPVSLCEYIHCLAGHVFTNHFSDSASSPSFIPFIDSLASDVTSKESVDVSPSLFDTELEALRSPIWQPAISNPIRLVKKASSPSVIPPQKSSEISSSLKSADLTNVFDANNALRNSFELREKAKEDIDNSPSRILGTKGPDLTSAEDRFLEERRSKRKTFSHADGGSGEGEDDTKKLAPRITKSTEEQHNGFSSFRSSLAEIPPFEPKKSTSAFQKSSFAFESPKSPGRVQDLSTDSLQPSVQGLAVGRLVANSVAFQPCTNSSSTATASSPTATKPQSIGKSETALRSAYAPYQDTSTFRQPPFEFHPQLMSPTSFLSAPSHYVDALWQQSFQSFNPQLVQQTTQPSFPSVHQLPLNSLGVVSVPMHSTPLSQPVNSTAVTIRKPLKPEDMENILQCLELDKVLSTNELSSRPELAKKISQLAQTKIRIERENTILKIRIDASAGLQRENDRLQEMLRQANEEDWSGSSGREAMALEIEDLKEEMVVISNDRGKRFDLWYSTDCSLV